MDLCVLELATKAIAKLTQVSGTYTANLKFDFIDHDVKSRKPMSGYQLHKEMKVCTMSMTIIYLNTLSFNTHSFKIIRFLYLMTLFS